MALHLAQIKPPGPSAGATRLQRGSGSCLGGSTGVQRREDDVMTQNQQNFFYDSGYVADCAINFYNYFIKNYDIRPRQEVQEQGGAPLLHWNPL